MNSSTAYPDLVFVVSRFPYPLEKGDKLRSYYQIRELSRYYSVHLLALSDRPVQAEWKAELEKYCKTVQVYRLPKWGILVNLTRAFLGKKPLQVGYFYNSMVAASIRKAITAIQPVQIVSQLIRTTEYTKNYHFCPKTLDYMDALSKGVERRIQKAPWYTRWVFKLESKRLRQYERTMFDYFELKTIISEQDRNCIFHPDRMNIKCIANGIDDRFFTFQHAKTPQYDLGFVGNMSYPPNIEAIEFIAREILPELKDVNLLVAGANPHPRVKKVAQHQSRITVSGWVDDIREAYADVRIFFAPMQIGTGMQNKLLEAMALGIPCITTSLANNAIHAVHGESILVADSTEEMIQSIQELLKNEALCQQIGESGKQFVRERYSWAQSTDELVREMQAHK